MPLSQHAFAAAACAPARLPTETRPLHQVLFTDILMRWLDTANVAGAATLPLAVLYLMQARTPSPSHAVVPTSTGACILLAYPHDAQLPTNQASPNEYLAVANADLETLQAEACLISWETQGTVQEPVCGTVSFDSVDDGYLCVMDESSGSLKWVCA